MGIYADKKSKVSNKNSRKKPSSSIYYDLPIIKSQRSYKYKDNENSDNKSCSEARMKYLMENYKSIVHYNSPEPKKYGAKAFTKNSEIYIAPGEESALPHELAHVYQQKTQNIPATDEINGEKVNTDPKLEKEANKNSKKILNIISKIISENIKGTKTKNVIQLLPRDTNKARIKEYAKNKFGIPLGLLSEDTVKKILNRANNYKRGYLSSQITTLENIVYPELQKIKNIIDISKNKGIYEYITVKDIDNILQKIDEKFWFRSDTTIIDQELEEIKTKIIFSKEISPKNIKHAYNLKTVMAGMKEDQCRDVKKCISRLKDYCNVEGINSVLKSANKNASESNSILCLNTDGTTIDSRYSDCFIKRLKLMTNYIEDVCNNKKIDGEKIGKKYWIRSTDSDPHHNAEHALYLVNKENQDGYKKDIRKKANETAKVYKPHDLSADNAVVGKNGILAQVNNKIKEAFNNKLCELNLRRKKDKFEDAFATMDIDVEHHAEEFVTKKSQMTQKEAQKYFFRMGALKAITDAMAIIDLHCNNIMPTEHGPIIIDAEVNFFHYGQSSQLADGAYSALTCSEVEGIPSLSLFDIATSEGNIKSCEAYENNKFNLKTMYQKGYQFMLLNIVIDQNTSTNTFTEIFRNQLEKFDGNEKIRILLLGTFDFANCLTTSITSEKNLKNNIASDLKNKITDNLTSENVKFLDKEKVKVTLNGNDFENEILETFKNGTIPAMYADMNGNIYLDNKPVGKIVSKVNEGTLILDKQLNKQQMIEIMTNCFTGVIKNLYEENF